MNGEYGLKNFMSHMITTIQYLNDNYIIKTKIEKYKNLMKVVKVIFIFVIFGFINL